MSNFRAGKLLPVGSHWVSRTMDVPVSDIRDDRILHEVNATSGDLRRIRELFAIKVETALRYLPNPDLEDLENLEDLGGPRGPTRPARIVR